MRLFGLLGCSALILVIAGAASAKDEGLDAFLAAMAEGEAVLDVSRHDLGKDGSEEALVRMSSPCEGQACEWRFVAKAETGWTVISSGFAEDAYLEETAGGDAVVNTDGITWAWSGTKLYPYASILENTPAVKATADELSFIAKNSKFTEGEKFTASLFRFDLFQDGSDDRIFLIRGLYYTVGTWGTPYLIFDDADRLIDSGVSMDMPRIFRNAKGEGIHVLEVTPVSTAIKTVK